MNATDQKIYDEAISWSIEPDMAQYIVCQARLETSAYTSAVFKDDNNCFGMHYAGQFGATQSSLHSEAGKPYAHYASIADSVADLAAWISNREADGTFDTYNIGTIQEYADALKAGNYYEETAGAYGGDMAAIYNQVFGGGADNGGSGGAKIGTGILIIGGLALILLLTSKN